MANSIFTPTVNQAFQEASLSLSGIVSTGTQSINGHKLIKNTTGQQITAYGYSTARGGASDNDGEIRLGIGPTSGFRIQQYDSGATTTYFDSRYDSASSSIQFRTRTDGTPVVAASYNGDGAWVLGVSGSSVQHNFNGFSTNIVGTSLTKLRLYPDTNNVLLDFMGNSTGIASALTMRSLSSDGSIVNTIASATANGAWTLGPTAGNVTHNVNGTLALGSSSPSAISGTNQTISVSQGGFMRIDSVAASASVHRIGLGSSGISGARVVIMNNGGNTLTFNAGGGNSGTDFGILSLQGGATLANQAIAEFVFDGITNGWRRLY